MSERAAITKAVMIDGRRTTLSLEPQFWAAMSLLHGENWQEWVNNVAKWKRGVSLSNAIRSSLMGDILSKVETV